MNANDVLIRLASLPHILPRSVDGAGAPTEVLNLLNGMRLRLAPDRSGWLKGIGKEKILELVFPAASVDFDDKKKAGDTDSTMLLTPRTYEKVIAAWTAQAPHAVSSAASSLA